MLSQPLPDNALFLEAGGEDSGWRRCPLDDYYLNEKKSLRKAARQNDEIADSASLRNSAHKADGV